MTRIRPLSLLLAPALALGIGACDNGTAPDIPFHGMDPVSIIGAVNGLSAPLQGPSEAITNLEVAGARGALAEAGVHLDSSVVEFPTTVAGSTFVFDQVEEAWVIDESSTDAPADGVRVMWYPLDSTGRIIDATPRGYMDIQPVDGAADDRIAVRVVESDDSGVPLLDFTRVHSWTENGDQIEYSEAEGSYSHDERVVDFSIEMNETTTAAGDVDFSYRSVMEDAETRYELVSEGVEDAATQDYDDAITATIERDGATTVVEVRFQGSGNTPAAVDGSVRHDGTTVALIGLRGGAYVFTGPDGEEVPATQANNLNTLFGTVTLNGLLLYYYELRLFFPTE